MRRSSAANFQRRLGGIQMIRFMTTSIDITGCDLRVLVQKAYELSRPQGMGILHFTEGPLPDEQVDAILACGRPYCPVNMDYVNGRAVKLYVNADRDRLSISGRWYDHTTEDLQSLLSAIGIQAPVEA